MTTALCMKCGKLKHGAYLDCPHCGEGPTGNNTLDLMLTDHYLDKEKLERLGKLWITLNDKSDDFDAALYAFYYIWAEYHPVLLSVDIPEDVREPAFDLIEAVDVEEVMEEDE